MKHVKVHVHHDHGRSPGASTPNLSPEEIRTRIHYGLGTAAPYLTMSWSEDRRESRLGRFFRRGVAYALGFDPLHAYANRHRMSDSDVVWTRTEHEALAVSLLRRLGLIRGTKIIAGAIWLWDEWPRRRVRRVLYRWLLQPIELHTAQSPENCATGSAVLGRTVHFLPYGIGPQAGIRPAAPQTTDASSIRIVAPGSDRHRDWDTLVRAVHRNTDMKLLILSRRRSAKRAARGCDRVSIATASSRQAIFTRYAEADVVAVPLKANTHNSGATVAFESVLAQRPLAITKVGGIDAYLGSGASWAAVGDADSMALAIRAASKAALPLDYRHFTDHGLTLADYALRHVLATWHVTGYLADPSEISALAPREPVVTELWRQR